MEIEQLPWADRDVACLHCGNMVPVQHACLLEGIGEFVCGECAWKISV